MSSRRRVLILYENTGGGHRKAAELLTEILQPYCESIKRHTPYEILGKPEDHLFVSAWNTLLRHDCIRLASWLVNGLLRRYALPIYEVTLRGAMTKAIASQNVDLVISVADGGNRLFDLACAELNIPFFIFITGLTVFRDNLSSQAQHLVYTPEMKRIVQGFDTNSVAFEPRNNPRSALSYVLRLWWQTSLHPRRFFLGEAPTDEINNQLSCQVIGLLRDKDFYRSLPSNDTPKRYALTLASGSLGGKFLKRCLFALESAGATLRIAIVCGSFTEKVETEKLLRGFRYVSGECFLKLPNLCDLFDSSEVVVSRLSTGVFVETLLRQVPLLVKLPVLSNEGGISLITEHKLGQTFCHYRELPKALALIRQNRARYIKNIQNYTSQCCCNQTTITANLCRELFNIDDEDRVLPHKISRT